MRSDPAHERAPREAVEPAAASPGAILHAGCLVRVDAPLAYADVVDAVAAVARRRPELRGRPSSLPIAAAVLERSRETAFDPARHVSAMLICERGDAPPDADLDLEVARAAARLWARPLAADRPPWEVTLLHGRGGTGTVLLVRAHHTLVDEGGGVELARDLLDAAAPLPTRGARPAAPPSGGLVPAALRELASLAERGVRGSAALGAELRALLRPGVALARTRSVGHFLESAGTLLSSPAPETPWNGTLGSERALVWQRLSLDVLRGVADAFGGTWSEAWLTVLGEALARHLRASGRPTAGLELLVYLPCGLEPQRRGDDARLVALPAGEMPAAARHAAVRARLEDPLGAARAASLAPLARLTLQLPVSLQPTVGSLSYQATNVVVTVVRAAEPFVTAAARKVVGVVPLAALPWHIGLGVSILAWRDAELAVGLTVDPSRVAEVGRLGDTLREAYVEVAAAAGVPAIDPARAFL